MGNGFRQQPGISVVIPAYGRVDALKRAIESVVSAQVKRVEIIVVDDASPTILSHDLPERNSSGVAIRTYRLHRNLGPQAARNLGIRRAHFTHIALLDSDDVFLPAKIDRLLRLIDQPYDLVFHGIVGMEKYHRLALAWSQHLRRIVPFDWLLAFYNPVATPGLMFRRCLRLGPPTMRHCEDYAFLLRYIETGTRVAYLPEILASVDRVQGTSGGLSAATWQMRRGEFRARGILLKTPTLRNLTRYAVGAAFGGLRIGNDVIRRRYRLQESSS